MNTNLLYLLLLTVLLAISCENNAAPSKSLPFVKEEHTRVPIDFIGKSIWVPNTYEAVTIDQYAASLDQLEVVSAIGESSLNLMAALASRSNGIAVFVDQEEPRNCFWLHDTPNFFLDLNRKLAAQYLQLLEQQMARAASGDDFRYEFKKIDSQYVTTNHSEMIKITYCYYYPEGEVYHTQYLVESNNKNVVVWVIGMEHKPLEDIVARIKL